MDSGFGRNELVDVVIRPEDMEFQKPGSGMLDGRVTSILFKGVHYEMKVQAGGFEWLAHSTEAYHPGTEVGIYVKPGKYSRSCTNRHLRHRGNQYQ